MSNKVPLAQATKESRKLKSVAKPKDMILDPMGQWKHPGENTRIPSNEITMQGVPYPVLAKPNVGQPIMMQPGAHYTFPGADYVDEFPKFAGGGMVEPVMDANGEPRCPDGYDYNPSTGYCEKKSSKCPDGYKPDGKGGCIEDKCQPGYVKDASGNCVPDTSGAIYVEDENDPRYQDYLTRKKLHHISNIENPEIRDRVYRAQKQRDVIYDQFYDPEKGYTFNDLKTEDGRGYLYNANGDLVTSIFNVDPNKGHHGSKRGIYKGLNLNQARNLEAYASSKGFDMGDKFNPYNVPIYQPDEYTDKYKPSKFDADVYYFNEARPFFAVDDNDNFRAPRTSIVEDEINRDRLKKYYPNITDADINADYAAYYNEYFSNIRDSDNNPWPHVSADQNLQKQIDVLSADDGSDVTMDEHKINIQDSAKAPNSVNAPLDVTYDNNGNPTIKGRRPAYKPESIVDRIFSEGNVLPYYDAPTDNYKFVTQPKSAELIQETQRAVPKYDEPELNLKENNLPVFTVFGPSKDRKHIHYNNPFIVGTSNKPLNWAPYSAALRAFTGYKKGDQKKLYDEVKAAREEGRPVNFEGIPLMGKTDLKHRKAYKKGLKEYEKRQPAIELENEKRRQQYEEQLKILNLQRQAEEDKRNKAGIDPNTITEWKKGGGLKSKKYSRSLQATNKFFRENPLFEKPKKLSKKRIYDPSAYYFQDGGENKTKLSKEEEKEFQKFYNTLPENLQTDDNTYDIRGYWDALGRPQEFDYTQPTEADGYYHGFSINPNTGEYLKSPAHPTFQHAVDEDRRIGYRPIPNVYGRNIATYNESIADPEQETFLRNTEGPANYQDGGLAKNNSNVYFNPSYDNTFTGGTNSYETYSDKFPIYKNQRSAVVGIEGSLGKRDIRNFTGNGWKYNAYAGLPYNAIKDKNYIPSAGIMFDYQNKPQDKKFSPQAQLAADYNSTDGLGVTATGGARFPLIGYSRKLKPGTGGGNLDVYGGVRLGANKDNVTGGLIYGSRIQGKYQPRWLDKISKGSYFYGDAGIQFDPVKGKNSQKETAQSFIGGTDQVTGNVHQGTMQEKDPGTKWGVTGTVNVGIKKDIDRIKFDNDKRAKKIQDIEDREQEYERERPIKPVEQKEPEEQTEWIGEHPRWLRDGGSTDNYIEIDIPKDQIQKYVDGGYIVEDISVPELNTYAEGGGPGDPFLKRLISQIKKGNESKKPVPSLTRKAPTVPIQNHSASTFPSSAEIKKQKERNKVQTLKEFTIEDQPQWVKDRNKYGVDKISWYESVNPKKWGLNDYSDYSSYNSAFRNAREAGEDEFVYKGERYNTKLIPKEQSDLYWESKNFLKNYYKTQPFIKDDSGTDISNLNNYQKQKYGFTTTELYDRGFDNLSPAENELLTKMMEEENAILKGELVNEVKYNSPIFIEKRKERLQKLDKPTYFSITTQKPKSMEEEGHWNEKKNKMFLNAKNDKLNTTYIHELSHKGDDSYESYESAPPIDMNKFNKQNLRTSGWSQKDFDYVSSPSEIESRKLSTLFYLYKNKKPWKAGKITTESLNNLYANIDDLPFDVRQLLQLYDAQQDDLLNYLNSNYNYEKKKEGGAVNYQLGDEIDEATMKRLKKLGYTFEEI